MTDFPASQRSFTCQTTAEFKQQSTLACASDLPGTAWELSAVISESFGTTASSSANGISGAINAYGVRILYGASVAVSMPYAHGIAVQMDCSNTDVEEGYFHSLLNHSGLDLGFSIIVDSGLDSGLDSNPDADLDTCTNTYSIAIFCGAEYWRSSWHRR